MLRAATTLVAAFAGIAHGDPQTLSLRQALQYAHDHQPSLAAARARVAVALAQADIPRAGLSPKISVGAELLAGTSNNTTASYATIGILDIARVGGTPANAAVSWTPEPTTLAGVAVHKELYDFGRLEAQGAAFDAFARAATEDARTVQLDLDLLVENSFYAVQGAKAILAAADAAVQRSQAHRDLANARVTAQLWSPIQLTRAEADLARYTVDRVRAAGSLAIAQDVLAATIGASVPAIDAGTDDVTFGAPPAIATGLHDLDTRSPELRAARAQLQAQQQLSTAIRDELKPDFSVSAELTTRAGGAAVATNATPTGAGWVPDVPNWDALVVFSWPVFDRVVTARARASERVEAVRAAELDLVGQQLRTAAQRAYVELEVAGSALPALQRALDAATANHAQAEAQFTAGLATAVELADAEALLTDAQIQLAVGQFQLARARAQLARTLAEAAP